jgi:glycerol-3-phosphate acyltransferase PlsY
MWALLLPVAYLIGTFPSASLVARANGIDIRTVGSRNPGASNITRVLGWKRGVWVFVLDAAKGSLAAGLGLVVEGRSVAYLLGALAVVGHIFPAWLRFRGGKGVATGGGVFAPLAPALFPILIGLWFVISKVTKKASLASIVVVALVPLGVWVIHGELWELFAAAGICALVMIRHLGNMKRLVTRKEPALT